MRGWKRMLGVLLAAGILLTAGCYAKEEGDEPSTGPESAAGREADVPYEATEEELAQLRKTLQNYIKGLGDEPYSWIYQPRGGDFADLKEDAAYDSLQVLGKSNDWTICLWREGLTVEHEDVLFMGKYAAMVYEFYFPYPLAVYVIKGDEVRYLQPACEEGVIDPEAVYHMLPEDMQWGLKADHPMVVNADPSLQCENL